MPVITILENELCRFPPLGVTDADGNRTVRKVMVPFGFGTLEQIKTYYLGVSFIDPDTGYLVRWLPYKDPDSFQYMVRLDHTGFAYRGREYTLEAINDIPFTTRFVPSQWVFTAHFSTLPYWQGPGVLNPDFDPGDPEPFILGTTPDLSEDGTEVTRYARKKIVMASKEVALGAGTIWLDTPGQRTQIKDAPTVTLPYQDIDVTWFWVPTDAVPWTVWDECIGKVNDAEMELPDFPDGRSTYDVETLLFEGVREEQVVFSDDTVGLHLSYGFSYLSGLGPNGSTINWNTYPDAGGTFRRAYRGQAATNTDGRYFKTNLSRLFVPRPLLTP